MNVHEVSLYSLLNLDCDNCRDNWIYRHSQFSISLLQIPPCTLFLLSLHTYIYIHTLLHIFKFLLRKFLNEKRKKRKRKKQSVYYFFFFFLSTPCVPYEMVTWGTYLIVRSRNVINYLNRKDKNQKKSARLVCPKNRQIHGDVVVLLFIPNMAAIGPRPF